MKKLDITKVQDNDSHWYWIPNELLEDFNTDLEQITGIDYMDNPDAFDSFSDKYEHFRTGGCPNLIPDFFNTEK